MQGSTYRRSCCHRCKLVRPSSRDLVVVHVRVGRSFLVPRHRHFNNRAGLGRSHHDPAGYYSGMGCPYHHNPGVGRTGQSFHPPQSKHPPLLPLVPSTPLMGSNPSQILPHRHFMLSRDEDLPLPSPPCSSITFQSLPHRRERAPKADDPPFLPSSQTTTTQAAAVVTTAPATNTNSGSSRKAGLAWPNGNSDQPDLWQSTMGNSW